jgi:acetyl esterase
MGARIDSKTFDPDRIDSATTEFNQMLIGGLNDAGWIFPPGSAQALRDQLAATTPPPEPSPRARTIDAGGIRVRVIQADDPVGIYIHCHPGGWTIGSALASDPQLQGIVDATGFTAASIEYRLAPEYPYPAGLDDCERATRWLLANGERELGAGRFVIGGESAGANLALCTLLRVNRDRPGAITAANLLYGNYDLTMTPSQRHAESGMLITRRALEWFYDQYVPDVSRRAKPDISPLYADLRGLPPILLSIGTSDSLVDDTLFLAVRLLASGVECGLNVIPGGEHSFEMGPVPSTLEALNVIHAFFERHACAMVSR